MLKKYYGVKNGRKIGVFNSWDECKIYVDGYQNAQYKSFGNYDDAYFFVWGEHKENSKKKQDEKKENYDIIAYVDGSYDNNLKRFSYAVIIFYNGERYDYANSDDDKNIVKLRNVSGELKAAMYVMDYAKKKGAKSISIYYDYAGIENWATGVWKANTEFTKYYVSYTKEIMKNIRISFEKVKAHSGDIYNEEVDRLAKRALLTYDRERSQSNGLENEKKSTSSILNLQDIQVLNASKRSLNLGFLINGNLLNSDHIYSKFKEIWKKQKRKLKDIKELKSYYDISTKQFIIIVTTEKDVKAVIIEGGALNG